MTATFPPYWGGTGNVAWHNARELARRGHEVRVFTAETSGPPEPLDGVEVRPLRPLVRVGNALLLPALLARLRGLDLIHLHYPFYFGAEMVALASRLSGIPYVVTYHNDVELAGALSWLPPLHHRLLGRAILRSASKVLFTTLDYGRICLAREFASAEIGGELSNGVDVKRFHPGLDGERVRRQHGIGEDELLVLFVGGLDRAHYFKGLPVLFDALEQLCSSVRLLVVGDGDLRRSYAARAAAMGLGERVRFAGRVGAEALPSHYAAADLLALPSLTRGEAFGVVLLEAMACAKPVVASDLPGVRAVVRSTGGGLMAVPGDATGLAAAIEDLADPARRLELGRAGRRAVEARYAWPLVAERLEAVYREVLSSRPGRATQSVELPPP